MAEVEDQLTRSMWRRCDQMPGLGKTIIDDGLTGASGGAVLAALTGPESIPGGAVVGGVLGVFAGTIHGAYNDYKKGSCEEERRALIQNQADRVTAEIAKIDNRDARLAATAKVVTNVNSDNSLSPQEKNLFNSRMSTDLVKAGLLPRVELH